MLILSFFDCRILILNAISVIVESYPELSGAYIENDKAGFDGSFDTIWDYAENLFTLLYTLEVVLKVTVDGWTKYSESPRNVFDFTITMAALFACAYVYYPNGFDDNRLITLVIVIRVLRLGRLFMALPQFQEM